MMQKSPSLEVISSEEHSLSQRAERRNIPRLDLYKEQFRLDKNLKVYPVINLSFEGMAIKVIESEDLNEFTLGSSIRGTLNLRGSKIAVQAQVNRLSPGHVACLFTQISSDDQKTLGQFLSPEALAKELHILPSGGFAALWFHGPSGTDLIFWQHEESTMAQPYERFTLFIYGSFIQWDLQEGWSTGRVLASNEQGETLGLVHLSTAIMDKDQDLDAAKLEIAKKLILSSNIPQNIKDFCLKKCN